MGFLATVGSILAGPAGAVIGAVAGPLIAGAFGKSASDKQVDAAKEAGQFQLQAAQESIAEQKRQFDIAQANQKPWIEAGVRSLGTMEELLRGPVNKYSKFTGTPGWKPQQARQAQGSVRPSGFDQLNRRDFGDFGNGRFTRQRRVF